MSMGLFKDPRMDMVFEKTWDSTETHCAKVAMSRWDEIKRLKNELDQYRALGPIDRLRELKQADDEGRCVVLPAGGYTDKDGENALKSAMNTCFYHNNPVTRFIADAVAEKLTHEEAEAALRREQDEKGGSSE